MHFRCLDFLQELRAEIDGDLSSQFGPEYLEREDQLSNLVGYLLMTAVMSERAVIPTEDSQQRLRASHPMISKTGALMTKFILKSGGTETKKLH